MDVKFDREIDALLRQNRPPEGAQMPAHAQFTSASHADPDEVAAFAEGLVPEYSRARLTTHFADCSQCREALSFVISTTETTTEHSTHLPVRSEVPAEALSWYRRLFTVSGLAAAMAMLIVVFGGAIFYFSMREDDGTDLARSVSTQADAAFNANLSVSSQAQLPAAANLESDAAMRSSPQASPGQSTSAAAQNAVPGGTSRPSDPQKKEFLATGSTATAAEAAVPPAPPPASVADVTAGAPMPKAAEGELKVQTDAQEAMRAEQNQQDRRRDSLLYSAKQRSGPARNSATNQQQSNLSVLQPGPERRVAGKTFIRRDGIWYDAEYDGGGATTVRRGTREFTGLGSTVREMASALDGTVILRWKSKNYRIQ